MTHAARIAAALAVLGFAAPALPCSDKPMKTTTASVEKPSTSGSVAKSAKKARGAKPAAEAKPVTASN